MYVFSALDVEVANKKTTVLKPLVSRSEVEEIVNKKKSELFGTVFTRPKQEEISVTALDLYYEPYWIIRGTYSVDYYRTNVYEVETEDTVREVKIANEVFSIKQDASRWDKIKRGVTGSEKKNHLEIPVEEHVIFDVEEEIITNSHGVQTKFDYDIDARTTESYPDKVIEENKDKIRNSKITKEDIVDKLVDLLRQEVDKDVRMLKEKATIEELNEVFVPIYEARCVDLKNKVKVLRVDGVKRKIIS